MEIIWSGRIRSLFTFRPWTLPIAVISETVFVTTRIFLSTRRMPIHGLRRIPMEKYPCWMISSPFQEDQDVVDPPLTTNEQVVFENHIVSRVL